MGGNLCFLAHFRPFQSYYKKQKRRDESRLYRSVNHKIQGISHSISISSTKSQAGLP